MPPKKKYRKKFEHKKQYKDINKVIDVNDVLVELKEENNRLLNELLFANKCLTILCEYKIFVDLISIKFKENLKSSELEKFRQLSEKVDQTIRTTNIDIKTIKTEINEEFGEQEVRDINGKSVRSNRLLNLEIVETKSEDELDDIEHDKKDDNNESEVMDQNDNTLNKKKNGRFKKLKESDDDYCPSDTSQHRFTDREALKTKRKFKCHFDGCKKSCFNRLLLAKHEKDYHSVNPDFICGEPECDYRTFNKKQLDNHFVVKHTNTRPFSCPKDGCEQAFATDRGLETHLKTHLKPKHICDECHQEFKREMELNSHRRKIHKIFPKGHGKYYCDFDGCNRKFNCEMSFQRHREEFHVESNRIYCPHPGCQFKAWYSDRMRGHMRSHSSEKQFKCDFLGCDRDFKHQKALTDHKKRHTSKPTEYICHFEGCERVYISKDAYNIHLANNHLKEKEYRCEWPGCDYKAYHIDPLRRHVKYCHSECIYPCDYPGCGKKFKSGIIALQHKQQVHLKVRKYPCSWPGCQYIGGASDKIKRHLLSHTKEKPFACEWPGCGFTSSQKSNVKVHMTTVHHQNVS